MKPEKIALKRATADMLKGVGGLEAAAGFCRVGKSALGDAQNVNCPDRFVTIDVVADLEPLAREREGWPHVTRMLCRLMGGAFVPFDQSEDERGDALLSSAALHRRTAEVTAAILEALANDQRIDAEEAAIVIERADQAQAVLAQIRQRMRAIISGELDQ